MEIKYNDEEPNKDEFVRQFKQAYILPVARKKKVREFLDSKKQDVGKIYLHNFIIWNVIV